MFPGTTSKASETTVASAASIEAKSDIVKVTGTTQINTIQPHFENTFGGFLVIVPTDGDVVLGTSGNILVGATAHQNLATVLMFVRSLAKWVIHDRT